MNDHTPTKAERLHILIVDDEEIIRNEIRDFLSRKNHVVFEARTPSEAFVQLAKHDIDIIILDVKLPEMNGIDVLHRIKENYPSKEVIMITGHGDSETILQSMKYGAFDFFHKPVRLIDIEGSIERTNKYIRLAKKLARIENEYTLLSNELQKSIGDIVGTSDAIRGVIELTLKAARAGDTSVLITGESGSGKELVAKVLHYASPRSENTFYPVNCSAIPESLVESEFFGHKKGSFTGAFEDKEGVFEAANNGTVFLDEIGDMPLSGQSKLLRVLEERKVKRIGSNKEAQVNVRVIAATNKDLLAMIEEGAFRSDLFYRLNTLEIHVPSLRERKKDIPLLLDHFIEQHTRKLGKEIRGIEPAAREMLTAYDFPGNVRELTNLVERACILCDGEILSRRHFPFLHAKEGEEASLISDMRAVEESLDLSKLQDLEKRMIEKALDRAGNNKTQAAKLLGITRFTFERKLKKYGLA